MLTVFISLIVPHVLLSKAGQTYDFSLDPEISPDVTLPLPTYQTAFPMLWAEDFGITKCGGLKGGENWATVTCHHWSIYSGTWKRIKDLPEPCCYGAYAAVGENKKWFGGGKNVQRTTTLLKQFTQTGNYTKQLNPDMQTALIHNCAVHLPGIDNLKMF